MKKLLLITGVLFSICMLAQSCAPSHGIPRPQRMPMPPKPMAAVQPVVYSNLG